jgi:hypothetical protein
MHDDAARRCSLLRNIVVEREKPGAFVKVFRSFFADARKVSLNLPYFLWFFLVVLLSRGRSSLEIVCWRSK